MRRNCRFRRPWHGSTWSCIDLVIVEGFKAAPVSKIEIHRPVLGKPLMAVTDRHVIAIATDAPGHVQTSLPLLALNDPAQVADFIEQFVARRLDMAEI